MSIISYLHTTIYLLTQIFFAQPKEFIAEYKCKKYITYDSSQKIEIRSLNSEDDDKSTIANDFVKDFISTSFYTYDCTAKTFNNQSSLIKHENFLCSSPIIRTNFNIINYLFRNDSLFKQEGFDLIFIDYFKDKPIHKFLKDSVTITEERINILGYDCSVAKSFFEDVRYYICKNLPKSINPGIMLKGADGAILGIDCKNYHVKLENLQVN
jgi:hypothetical protein